MVTITRMSAKKDKKAKAPADRKKPTRMVRIPEQFAVLLEQVADQRVTDLTEETRNAVREYLEKLRLRQPASLPPDTPI